MINVDEVYEEARVAFDAGRYAEVIAQLTDAVLEGSVHPQLYFFRGIARHYSARDEQAIEDLSKAIILKPDYFRALLNRGKIWSRLGQHNEALVDINKAIKLRPDYASAYCHLGSALNAKGSHEKAIVQLNTAIELDPASSEAYLQRGTAYLSIKEYTSAVEDLSRAILIRPDFASAYTSRGLALYRMEKYEEAIDSFNEGIRLNPLSGRAHVGLGRVYHKTNRPGPASTCFKRAFYLGYDDSRQVDIFKNLAPAPYIVKAIVSNKPKADTDFATIEWLLSTCTEWDRYLQHLQDKGGPSSDPETYYRLAAIVHYYMGNSIAAYHIFDKKFDADEYPYPLTIQDQYYLALSAMDFNEPDNGLAYALSQAAGGGEGPDGTEVDGQDTTVETYYTGQLHLLDGDPDSALSCFRRCTALLPALYGELNVYLLKDDGDAALATAKKIASIEAGASGFLDGVEPLQLHAGMSLKEGARLIQQHLYYYEWRTVVDAARELLGRPPLAAHLPFHAALVFTP